MISDPFQEEDHYDYTTDYFKLSQIFSLIRVFRLLKAIRLIKIIKLKKILTTIEDSLLNYKIAMIFIFVKLAMFMILVAHWAACVWNMSALETETEEAVTWKKIYEQSLQEEMTLAESYISALYWAFTTMATVGFGDIHPNNTVEMVIGIITMGTSSTIFAYIIGTGFSGILRRVGTEKCSSWVSTIVVFHAIHFENSSIEGEYKISSISNYMFYT